jgi:hypothetical protein
MNMIIGDAGRLLHSFLFTFAENNPLVKKQFIFPIGAPE